MEADVKTIDLFSTRVRQMILQYNALKQDNAGLREQLSQSDARIGELEAQLQQMRNDYNSLKMARMVEITSGDMESAQKRLAQLIRSVDKCITLVNEKQ